MRGLFAVIAISVTCQVTHAQSCPPRWAGLAVNATVRTLEAGPGGTLYVGGDFTSPVPYVAALSGSALTPVGTGLGGSVLDIMSHDDGFGPRLYVTGFVNVPGTGQSTVTFARLNGGLFQAFGLQTGPASWTGHMASYNFGGGPRLVVTSPTFMIGCDYVGEWNGTNWTCMGAGLGSVIHDSAIYNDGSGPALYCTGSLVINNTPFSDGIGIARWNGSAWTAVGGGLRDGPGNACTVFDSGEGPELVVAGQFTRVGPITSWVSARRIARWNGTRWAALGAGVDRTVNAVEPFDDGSGLKLYVGGEFLEAGGMAVQRIARWDGATWSSCPAGGPVSGVVYDLCVYDPDGEGPLSSRLGVGGTFSVVGQFAAQNLAILVAGQSIDFNNDGLFPDTADIQDFLSVFSGGSCPTGLCGSIDFNGDGIFPDTADIDSLLSVFAGGPCF